MSTALGFLDGLAYGADYNPEQWGRDVWEDDLELMRRARVNLVSLAIFSWALLEPEPGRYEFGWLDNVMDGLAAAGIRADLANATASPPAWLSHRHPEVLPVTADGRRMSFGARQAYCPSSTVFRDASLSLTREIAERYRQHPALAMWHVSNEIGCHNAHCYCDVSAAAFRRWLEVRYRDLDTLNDAWGTAFWSQRYGSWDEITPPRVAPAFVNPTQQLDFRRFSSDACLDVYRAQRDVLRSTTPDLPITTNFMVMQFQKNLDYASWAPEVDILANDHYLQAADPDAHIELAFAADHCRGLAGGGPWMVMEHSPSAVNWQPRNVAKLPGEMIRNSLQHVARGSDGVMFFQWRASAAGAEKFHSGMVPHAGTKTKTYREVVRLGRILERLGEIAGTKAERAAAIVFDWEAWWAVELGAHPTIDVTYLDRMHAIYEALWRMGITVDVVPPSADLDEYRLVIVPTLYLTADDFAERLESWVAAGGTALVTYLSGIVDPSDHVRLGGYPGAFRALLGIRSEEFFPLRSGETVHLDDGSTADVWTELLHLDGAKAVASFTDGPVAGVPAITLNRRGDGTAWYMATRLDGEATHRLVKQVADDAGVKPAIPMVTAPSGLEVVRRSGPAGSYLFLINHGDETAHVAAAGYDLVGDREIGRSVSVRPGDVAVIREEIG